MSPCDADFRKADMFACCDHDSKSDPKAVPNNLEVYETASTFSLLLRLLHDPPSNYSSLSYKEGGWDKYAVMNPDSAIPFPVLPLLYQLADKYVVSPPIIQALNSNLQAYASTFPLKVYGLASQLSLDWIADEASAFLVQPPLHKYTNEEIKIISSAEAYHKLLKLQHYRAAKIKEILLHEELFPHGYGVCTSHKGSAEALWDQKRRTLLSRIDAGNLTICNPYLPAADNNTLNNRNRCGGGDVDSERKL